MEAVLEKGISQKKYAIENDSMESWQIEKQLAEINVPYLPLSWKDEFLMAENLQNYFAEVIATFSHIRRKKKNTNFKEEFSLEKRKIKWLDLRNKYHLFSLSERQQLLIDLMTENKYLSANYGY